MNFFKGNNKPKKKINTPKKTIITSASIFMRKFSYKDKDGSQTKNLTVSNTLKSNLDLIFGKDTTMSFGYVISLKKAFRWLLPVGDPCELYMGHSTGIPDRHYRHFKGLNCLENFTNDNFKYQVNFGKGLEIARYITELYIQHIEKRGKVNRNQTYWIQMQKELGINRISDMFSVYVESLSDANTEKGDEEKMLMMRFKTQHGRKPIVNIRLEKNKRIKTLISPAKTGEFFK